MKHLLNGVAIAAALAIAAPAWAQAPMTPGAPRAPGAAAPAAAAAEPAAPKKMSKQRHRPMRHAAKAKGGKRGMRASAGDSMTEQLNREELARLQGGMPQQPMGGMPPGPANAGAGQGGPRASGR